MTGASTAAGGVERREIRALPVLLVNQIAAGEVVERPASVVKELVENAIDAGASRISVELEQGGIEKIAVSDDGCGIGAGQLTLAISPHATSKIAAPEDLDRITTMGFRGEALASIASVSRMSVRSRTLAEAGASVIEVEGDAVSAVKPAAGAVGTTVTVRTLFFNTPARRKFLKTVATEEGRCVDAVEDLALGNPSIGFIVTADGRRVLDLPAGQTARERALAVLGAELENQLLVAEADQFDDARGVAMWGLVGRPSVAKRTARATRVFLNGRAIKDRTVQHAISEAYRGLIEPGRYPTAVVMLEMDPRAVDVNVHPAKTEVRFRDSSLVHSVVHRAVRDALRGADLTPTFSRPSAIDGLAAALPGPGRVDGPVQQGGGVSGVRGGAEPQQFVDYFKRFSPGAGARLTYDALREAVQSESGSASAAEGGAAEQLSADVAAERSSEGQRPGGVAEHAALSAPQPVSRVLQVHNSYLVTQDEQGVVIIDQHALHERVMFEYLMLRVGGEAGTLESQRLLTPAVVPAAARQIDRLPELEPVLKRLGIEAERMGPGSVAVHAFPTFLFDRGVEPGEFVQELLEKADDGSWAGVAPGSEAMIHEVVDMMACKAAVKAGDRMSDVELAELMKLREAVERSSSCPHGRPTSVRLTIKELEKLFHRA